MKNARDPEGVSPRDAQEMVTLLIENSLPNMLLATKN